MNEATEEWRVVPGFPDYEVSDQGRVRSWRVSKTEPRLLTYRPIGAKKNAPLLGRYNAVALYNEAGRSDRSVHHLVLEAFVGPRPSRMQGCHNNDDPNDNRLENLRWDTSSANQRDRKDVGQPCKGNHPQSERALRGYCRQCRREAYHAGKV